MDSPNDLYYKIFGLFGGFIHLLFYLLKDKTFHRYNRFYLMLTLFISVLLPLLKVSILPLK